MVTGCLVRVRSENDEADLYDVWDEEVTPGKELQPSPCRAAPHRLFIAILSYDM